MEKSFVVKITESLGAIQGTLFVAYMTVLLILVLIAFQRRKLREAFSLVIISLGILIYIHSSLIAHVGLARYHEFSAIAAGADPHLEHISKAQYHTKIYTFQSLAMVAVFAGTSLLAFERYTAMANTTE